VWLKTFDKLHLQRVFVMKRLLLMFTFAIVTAVALFIPTQDVHAWWDDDDDYWDRPWYGAGPWYGGYGYPYGGYGYPYGGYGYPYGGYGYPSYGGYGYPYGGYGYPYPYGGYQAPYGTTETVPTQQDPAATSQPAY
jgi:hypothetical protein